MMDALFDAIVNLLQAICRQTGLTYPEINILIYCGIIPATWAVILYLRQRRFWWVIGLHGCLMLYYLQMRRSFSGFSKQFYDMNIAALEWGATHFKSGYVGISLLTGVILPVLIYGLLWLAPKRWSGYVYLALLLGNLAYYGWVYHSFAHQPDY
jgi:hypothetical protein